jgi:hypothetical protein
MDIRTTLRAQIRAHYLRDEAEAPTNCLPRRA